MDAGDSDKDIHNRFDMVTVMWNALKKDTNDDPHQRRLKEMADHLHFWKEEIEGMTLLESVRLAS